jgi:nucleoside phosphorylase
MCCSYNDDRDYQLGDVIVSYSVQGHEGCCANGDGLETSREYLQTVSRRPLQRIRTLEAQALGSRQPGPKILVGKIISGSILVDHRETRKRLVVRTGNDALGIEMEGVAVAETCAETRVDWMLIKGIADFGDSHKASARN